MKATEKWNLWRYYLSEAHVHIDVEETSEYGWYYLLLAEETVYAYERSDKQQRQQKLWQQRGLLERTKANLRTILQDGSIKAECDWEARALMNAENHIRELIRRNQQQMKAL